MAENINYAKELRKLVLKMLNEKIRALCIEQGYFALGTENQYRRMFDCAFDVLENQISYTIHDIAIMISICSDEEFSNHEIERKLNSIFKECGYNGNS